VYAGSSGAIVSSTKENVATRPKPGRQIGETGFVALGNDQRAICARCANWSADMRKQE
jgi:hypothetical protein